MNSYELARLAGSARGNSTKKRVMALLTLAEWYWADKALAFSLMISANRLLEGYRLDLDGIRALNTVLNGTLRKP